VFKLDHTVELPSELLALFAQATDGQVGMEKLMAILNNYDDLFVVGGAVTRLTAEQVAAYEQTHREMVKKAFMSGRQFHRDPMLWLARTAKLSTAINTIYQEVAVKQQKGNCTTCAVNQAVARVIPLLTDFWKANPDSNEAVELLTPEYVEYLKTGVIPDKILNVKLPKVLPGQQQKTTPALASATTNTELQKDRPACTFCFLKHLGSAIILLKEVASGYTPDKRHPHFALALAHLSEAENEIIVADSATASAVREVRLSLTGQEG